MVGQGCQALHTTPEAHQGGVPTLICYTQRLLSHTCERLCQVAHAASHLWKGAHSEVTAGLNTLCALCCCCAAVPCDQA
jgi:hypothetical protein